MTNTDAERVSDIVPVAWRVWSEIRQGWMVLEGSLPPVRHTKAEPLYTADIIEAQSKALAEARAIAVRMREITQDVWDKREGYTDRQAWSDLHGQAMQLLGWEVKSRSLTPTPENPNG